MPKITSKDSSLSLCLDGKKIPLTGAVFDEFDFPPNKKPRLWHRIITVGNFTTTYVLTNESMITCTVEVIHGTETHKQLSNLQPSIDSPFVFEKK